MKESLLREPQEAAGMADYPGDVPFPHVSPAVHQTFANLLWSGLRRCARDAAASHPDLCWKATTETNVFLGRGGKSDFLTPDFLVHRCLELPYQDVRATDVLLVGEVLSPSNTRSELEAKKGRYASAGIPWYWEVSLAREASAIASVRAYGLQSVPGELPEGVHPLLPANYLLIDEWTPATSSGIEFDFPFPINIPWSELEY